MFNHGATLLFNTAASVQTLGRIPAPATFAPKNIPADLESLRLALLGGPADRVLQAWRVRELLTCIHGCGLSSYLTDLDSRVTYWPLDDTLFSEVIKGPVAKQLTGTSRSAILSGDASVSSRPEQIYFEWFIDILSETSMRISTLGNFGRTTTADFDYEMVDGLSSPVRLPGSKLVFQFNGTGLSTWRVTWLARPKQTIAESANQIEIAANAIQPGRLFSKKEDYAVEPYRTFEDFWLSNDQLPFRLAGLTLATIYRINEQ